MSLKIFGLKPPWILGTRAKKVTFQIFNNKSCCWNSWISCITSSPTLCQNVWKNMVGNQSEYVALYFPIVNTSSLISCLKKGFVRLALYSWSTTSEYFFYNRVLTNNLNFDLGPIVFHGTLLLFPWSLEYPPLGIHLQGGSHVLVEGPMSQGSHTK